MCSDSTISRWQVSFSYARVAVVMKAREGPYLSQFGISSLEATCGFAARCAEWLCPSGSEPRSLTLSALGARKREMSSLVDPVYFPSATQPC